MLDKLPARRRSASPTAASPARCTDIGDNFITVEVADNVRIRVQKGAVGNVLPKGTLKSA